MRPEWRDIQPIQQQPEEPSESPPESLAAFSVDPATIFVSEPQIEAAIKAYVEAHTSYRISKVMLDRYNGKVTARVEVAEGVNP